MKTVLLAIAVMFSVVSTNAWASGCDPRDGGSEVISKMDVVISGNLVCKAGAYCFFEVSGSDLKLYGTEISVVDGSQLINKVAAGIVFENSWGSCDGNYETVVLSVVINGQTFSGQLSSHPRY